MGRPRYGRVRVPTIGMTEQQRGKLKIFMGYAAGVGKTYKMLEEAQELKAAGVDEDVRAKTQHAYRKRLSAPGVA